MESLRFALDGRAWKEKEKARLREERRKEMRNRGRDRL